MNALITPADWVVTLLGKAHEYRDPGRSITGWEHALRCAALGETDEDKFVGLVHDLARPLSEKHHGQIMALIIEPYVSSRAYRCVYFHDTELRVPDFFDIEERAFALDYEEKEPPRMPVLTAMRLIHRFLVPGSPQPPTPPDSLRIQRPQVVALPDPSQHIIDPADDPTEDDR